MKDRTIRLVGVTFLALTLFGLPALAADNCDGYSKRQRLTKLGGPNSFGSSIDSVGELQQYFEDHRDDIVFLMETQGLIDAVPGLFEAVRSGDVTERNLHRGDKFEWMAYRWRGKPKLTDHLCVDTDDAYGVFEVVLNIGEDGGEPAQCQISAAANCEWKNETATVDVTGSSPGVAVSMKAGSGSDQPLGDLARWDGRLRDPYRNDHVFTATVEDGPVQKFRQIRLVIPKICLNIALVSDDIVEIPSPGCSEMATVSCPVTVPSCSISASKAEPWTGEDVDIQVTGDWPGDEIRVDVIDADGGMVGEPAFMAPFPNTVSFGNPGTYTLKGTATNEIGETATCTTEVTVHSRWTLRPLVHYADPASGQASRVRALDPPFQQERSMFNADSGYGFEVSLEYHVNDRIGVEGRVSYSIFDSLFKYDIDTDWEMDDDTFSLTSFTVGPDIHLTPASRLDFFLTPFVGYASLSGVDYNVLGRNIGLDFDNQFTWGLALGLDVPLGEATPWNLSFSARYMDLDAEDDNYQVGLDPFFLGAGFAYDF